MDLFRTGTRVSVIPIPLTTTIAQFTCASLICERALQAFGYDSVNRDMVWAITKNHVEGSLGASVSQFTVGMACAAALFVFPLSLPFAVAADIATSAATVTRQARVLVFSIADVILILDKAFWVRRGLEDSNGIITDEDLRAASDWYQGKVGEVHDNIKSWLPVLNPSAKNTVYRSLFHADKVKSQLEEVIEKYRFKPDDNSRNVWSCSTGQTQATNLSTV